MLFHMLGKTPLYLEDLKTCTNCKKAFPSSDDLFITLPSAPRQILPEESLDAFLGQIKLGEMEDARLTQTCMGCADLSLVK